MLQEERVVASRKRKAQTLSLDTAIELPSEMLVHWRDQYVSTMSEMSKAKSIKRLKTVATQNAAVYVWQLRGTVVRADLLEVLVIPGPRSPRIDTPERDVRDLAVNDPTELPMAAVPVEEPAEVELGLGDAMTNLDYNVDQTPLMPWNVSRDLSRANSASLLSGPTHRLSHSNQGTPMAFSFLATPSQKRTQLGQHDDMRAISYFDPTLEVDDIGGSTLLNGLDEPNLAAGDATPLATRPVESQLMTQQMQAESQHFLE